MACTAELRGLGAVNDYLKQAGGRLLAVAVDPPQDAKRVAERNGLPYQVLCDTEREVIRNYGLVHAGGAPDGSDVAIPAQMLVGPDGRILWRYISRRIQDRLDPAEVLEIVKRLVGSQNG